MVAELSNVKLHNDGWRWIWRWRWIEEEEGKWVDYARKSKSKNFRTVLKSLFLLPGVEPKALHTHMVYESFYIMVLQCLDC